MGGWADQCFENLAFVVFRVVFCFVLHCFSHEVWLTIMGGGLLFGSDHVGVGVSLGGRVLSSFFTERANCLLGGFLLEVAL